MSQRCNVCQGTGFINLEQLDDLAPATLLELSPFNWREALDKDDHDRIADYIAEVDAHEDNDAQVCGCCGDGGGWYGVPGEHYNEDDPPGKDGPYAYNGGLCECH